MPQKFMAALKVIARSSFGFWLSYFAVISRVVLSMFWFSIQVGFPSYDNRRTEDAAQSYVGSECVYQMLKAIWPSTARIPNHLSASAGITTVNMMCYFLFWLIQFPFLLVSPQRIRHLFVAKAVLVPVRVLHIHSFFQPLTSRA